jgi:hypothetical protein
VRARCGLQMWGVMRLHLCDGGGGGHFGALPGAA